MTVSEFISMGGYAEFVWGSFGFTALVMVFNVVSARRRLRLSLQRIAERAAYRQRPTGPGNAGGEERIES